MSHIRHVILGSTGTICCLVICVAVKAKIDRYANDMAELEQFRAMKKRTEKTLEILEEALEFWKKAAMPALKSSIPYQNVLERCILLVKTEDFDTFKKKLLTDCNEPIIYKGNRTSILTKPFDGNDDRFVEIQNFWLTKEERAALKTIHVMKVALNYWHVKRKDIWDKYMDEKNPELKMLGRKIVLIKRYLIHLEQRKYDIVKKQLNDDIKHNAGPLIGLIPSKIINDLAESWGIKI